MSRDVFLTVMAVLDENAQALMGKWQKRILSSWLAGTQTMGIPFHITLGSFPLDAEEELVSRIRAVSMRTSPIPLTFSRLNSFQDRVLFADPESNEELKRLHLDFDNNYGNGFPWVPHATLFCGETEEVKKAFEILKSQFQPFQARITAIELGKFFPAKFISRYDLRKV